MAEDFEGAERIWRDTLAQASEVRKTEPVLVKLLDETVFASKNLDEAVCRILAEKLGRKNLEAKTVYKIFMEAFKSDPEIGTAVARDLCAIHFRDPACAGYLHAMLFYKGFQAISTHRVAHRLWLDGRKFLAYYFQSMASEIFGVDIHPAPHFGAGIFLDHATSFVAGETSDIADDVSILHEVTLGGTGNETGDRHPKIKSGVLIGAGAKLIGNITIGEGAKIGAGSVVLDDVKPHTTVAGVPAKRVGRTSDSEPSQAMNQHLC